MRVFWLMKIRNDFMGWKFGSGKYDCTACSCLYKIFLLCLLFQSFYFEQTTL